MNERDLRERARAAVPGLHEERRGRLLDAEAAADAARLLDEGEVGAREVHWVAVRVDLVCVGRTARRCSEPAVCGRLSRGGEVRTRALHRHSKSGVDLRQALDGFPIAREQPRPSTHPPTRRSSSSRARRFLPLSKTTHSPHSRTTRWHTMAHNYYFITTLVLLVLVDTSSRPRDGDARGDERNAPRRNPPPCWTRRGFFLSRRTLTSSCDGTSSGPSIRSCALDRRAARGEGGGPSVRIVVVVVAPLRLCRVGSSPRWKRAHPPLHDTTRHVTISTLDWHETRNRSVHRNTAKVATHTMMGASYAVGSFSPRHRRVEMRAARVLKVESRPFVGCSAEHVPTAHEAPTMIGFSNVAVLR